LEELYAVLLSWAVTLSGHPMPAKAPDVVMVPHAHLVQAACGGRECKVMGWFPPGERIYLDERLKPRDDLLATSVVVHEMVHYLQYVRRGRPTEPYSCPEAMAMEREAYQVQREFLHRYGVYQPVGVSMHHAGCQLTAQ
jgi:hypothetical protein